jgi:hypothetical protein
MQKKKTKEFLEPARNRDVADKHGFCHPKYYYD